MKVLIIRALVQVIGLDFELSQSRKVMRGWEKDWFDGWLNAQQCVPALQNWRKGSTVCRLLRRCRRTGSWSLRGRVLAFFAAFAVLLLEAFDGRALDGLLYFRMPAFILLFAVFFLQILLLSFVQGLVH